MVAVVSPERERARATGPAEWYGRSARPVTVWGTPTVCRPRRLPASTYRRRRAVAAGLVVLVVLVLSAALGPLGGGPLPVPERPDAVGLGDGTRVYVVQPGDTFWSIARRLDPRADPRPLVDRLVAAHGTPVLHVGERLPVPAP